MKKLLAFLAFFTACDATAPVDRTRAKEVAAGTTSFEAYATDRALDLLGADKPDVFYDPFFALPGTPASPWLVSGSGTVSTGEGAKLHLDATAPAIYARATLGATDRGLLGDPATTALYVAARFRLRGPVSNISAFGVGLTNPVATLMAGVLYNEPGSGFHLFEASAAGLADADSSVIVDQEWHISELWFLGDGLARGAFDGEEALAFTVNPIGAAVPAIVLSRGSVASLAADVDAVVYVVPQEGW